MQNYNSVQGIVEIELKGARGKGNPVFRRVINKVSNSSEFFINGQPVSKKRVIEEVRKLNVNVNSLLSFLAQDKVSQFPTLTPKEILAEVEASVGEDTLIEDHKYQA